MQPRLRHAIAVSALAISAATAAQAQDVVCVVEEWCEALREPFFEDTGIRMEFMNLRTNESLVRIRAEASNPTFDVLYGGTGEALDRLSRDQEDIAGFFKRMAFAGVKIVTLSEGEVTHLHIGLKWTMSALFLKDLADKTRRGQRGRVELGRSGGGNCFGYDVVRRIDAAGEPERGERAIDPVEAEVIRRIFRDYAAGKSPKRIATKLNAEGISAPTGGAWGFSTINGNAKRGTGILDNELYIGRLVWNRQRFVKDPDTGKRQARPNSARGLGDPGGTGAAHRRGGPLAGGEGAPGRAEAAAWDGRREQLPRPAAAEVPAVGDDALRRLLRRLLDGAMPKSW